MDYSKRMLRDLCQYVQSEFVLVIQWDGYVLNPDVWDDGFLEYDYIGACWGYDNGKMSETVDFRCVRGDCWKFWDP